MRIRMDALQNFTGYKLEYFSFHSVFCKVDEVSLAVDGIKLRHTKVGWLFFPQILLQKGGGKRDERVRQGEEENGGLSMEKNKK